MLACSPSQLRSGLDSHVLQAPVSNACPACGALACSTHGMQVMHKLLGERKRTGICLLRRASKLSVWLGHPTPEL